MYNLSVETFEKHWLYFSNLPQEKLIDIRDLFAKSQPSLYEYLLNIGTTHKLTHTARSILVYVCLALWDFLIKNQKHANEKISTSYILTIEVNNTQLFLPLDQAESFQNSLNILLDAYPAKDLFIYLGQMISSRELGREEMEMTADQRGWIIIYLKVLMDALLGKN